MRWLLWLIGAFALAAGLALFSRLGDGFVMLVVPPWRIEVSIPLFGLGLLAAFLALYVLTRSIVALVELPARVATYRERMARERSFRQFESAFRLLFEGRYGRALKKARESFAGGGAPGMAALVAARAAQRLRREDEQNQWLAEATRIEPAVQSARWLLEAEMHLDNRRFDQALEALAQLQRTRGRNVAAMRLELRARQGVGDWAGVLVVARALMRRKGLAAEAGLEVLRRAHRALLRAQEADSRAVLKYLRGVPLDELDSRLVAQAATALLALNLPDDAAYVLEGQLEREWEPELVVLYGACVGGSVAERIAQAEKWLLDHPHDAGLLLVLGRLCAARQLWGKAQSYLEASLAIGRSREAHLALACLLDQLDRREAANQQYRLAAMAA